MSYSVKEAKIEDSRDLLIALWERNYQDVNASRFEWIYERTYGGKPIVFFLKHNKSQTIVGAIVLFPRLFYENGKKIQAYICGDLVVDSGHRSLGPAITLLKASIRKCEKSNPCILLSFPNSKSEPVALRAGFKVVGRRSEMTRPLNTQIFFTKHFGASLIANGLSIILNWTMRFRYDHLLHLHNRWYTYEVVSELNEKFDDLGLRLVQKFPFIGERNSLFLNWRFNESPYGDHKYFTLISTKNNVLHGYIAYCVTNNCVNITDIAFDGKKSINIMLSLFNKFHRQAGLHRIEINITSNALLINQFKRNGYFSRGQKDIAISYSSKEELDFTKHTDNLGWYLTQADNDI